MKRFEKVTFGKNFHFLDFDPAVQVPEEAQSTSGRPVFELSGRQRRPKRMLQGAKGHVQKVQTWRRSHKSGKPVLKNFQKIFQKFQTIYEVGPCHRIF